MPAQKHIHKYYRLKLGKKQDYVVFQCGLSDCSHYVPEALAYGKQTLCWSCGNPMLLTKKFRKIKYPHCDCRKTKRSPIEERIENSRMPLTRKNDTPPIDTEAADELIDFLSTLDVGGE